ncbi:DUF4230 domain-containing protein [Synechocystis sp. PCC 7339]|uniref:DUF4230 domain-containing protein n=1 Tax=unclassified Synechocystis TaxID=2640012 RepID=UPI001BAF631D|nr:MULTISPECIES: DUF4230 domain-containing protein [unclassified Synechocystis]QUS59876.1 DUF4230 domain-containing protein [Synechocystis sp. PCC 7338]UAJ72668.1 DUF4230 domain-containing protein [Synechocystis sp. PCC 7339]
MAEKLSSLQPARKNFQWLPLLGAGGIVLTMAIAVMFIGQGLRTISPWLRIGNSEAKGEISTLVVQQIRAVSELSTTIFAMETVIPTSQERQWGNFTLGRTDLLYIGYGEVRAGIDLEQLSEQNIEQKSGKLIVTLPAPKILDQKIDVERSRIYQYDRGFLNLGPDTAPELQSLAQRQTLAKITAAACDQGILDQANEQAEIAVGGLLRGTGYTEVEIKTSIPGICAPSTSS